VYYFGFVITLFTLIAAVFSIVFVSILEKNSVINLMTIGLQFGLGLFATGYALIARLQLQLKNETISDVEDAYAIYFDRVNSLLGRVDSAYADIDNLMKKVIDRFRTQLEEEANQNTERLTAQIEDSFAPLLEACHSLATQIGENGLGIEISNMRTAIADSNKSFKTFDTRLQSFSANLSSASEPLLDLGKALNDCQHGSEKLSIILNNLRIDPNLTATFEDSVNHISTSLTMVANSVQRLESEFNTNSEQVSEAFNKFNTNLISSTQILAGSMTSLANAMATSSSTLNNSIRESINDAPTK